MLNESAIPNVLFFSEDFVISAGSVLFRVDPETIDSNQAAPTSTERDESSLQPQLNLTETSKLQICLLLNNPDSPNKSQEWLLPKGRKDVGESISDAAIRETFEETGYQCVLLPTNMLTRAPVPDPEQQLGEQHDAKIVPGGGCTEPIAIQVRPTPSSSHVGSSSQHDQPMEGRQKNEKSKVVKFVWWYITVVSNPLAEKDVRGRMDYEKFDSVWMDADDAVEKLSFDADREVARRAIQLVRDSQSSQKEV